MIAALSRWTARLSSASSRGFTLIEMSIVLVIIGLIIGGILKGQEIIAEARAKAVVNEVNAARGAVNTYFDRYRALPGDDVNGPTRVDPRLVAGNGDGAVGPTPGPNTAQGLTNVANANQGENYQYFKALGAARLLNGMEVGPIGITQSTNFGTGSSLPTAPITGSGMTIVYGTHDGDGTNATTRETGHWYRIHKNATTPAPAFTPRELANIDNMIDDGLPGEGGVRGDGTSACAPTGQGALYTLSDQVACVGFFTAHP